MKKIKSIRHLQAEKKSIRERQDKLEKEIRDQWNELKASFKPANIAAGALNFTVKNKTAENLNTDSVLKNTFTYGITLLANKLLTRTGEKMSRVFKK